MIAVLVAATLLVASAATPAAELTTVDINRSSITFVSRQMNVPMNGRFKRFAAQIAIDPARPENGRAQIDIDVASIDSGSSEGDEEAKTKDWFDTPRFPRATFVSQTVKAVGGGKYQALGKLYIKGRSKDVATPFVLRPDAGGIWFEGGFTLRRLEFGIGSGSWGDTSTVADEVQIRYKFFVKS